ncbi:MAG: hypothetical protein U0326_29520 [Polyangiales bacterium]
MWRRVFSTVCVAMVAGCVGGDDQTGAGDVSDETLTVVHLRGDAAPEITVVPSAARAQGGVTSVAQATTQDTACGNDSMWLYAGVNRTGARVCFTGTGQVSLDSICLRWYQSCTGLVCRPLFCLQSWSGAVRSYWAGNASSNKLQRYTGDPAATAPTCTEYSLAFRQQNTALDCGRSATHLWLGSDFAHELFGNPTVIYASDPNPADLTLNVGNIAGATSKGVSNSATITGTTTVSLTGVADNPGGVRNVTIGYSSVTSCRATGGDPIGSSTTTDYVPVVSSDTLSVGASTYTRRTASRSITLSPGSCRSGMTVVGTSYTFSATATTYGGVTVSTPIVSVRVNP